MAHEAEARRLSESAGRWRTLAWVLTVLGLIGIVVLSYYGARTESYDPWSGYGIRQFSAGAFFLNVFIYSLIFLVTMWPYFIIAQLMNGLSAALTGRGGGGWLRAKAANWRVVSWVITVLGGIGAGLAAWAISELGRFFEAWEDSGPPFFLLFFLFYLFWMLEIWPFFMLCRTLEGAAALAGEPESSYRRPLPPVPLPAEPPPADEVPPPAAYPSQAPAAPVGPPPAAIAWLPTHRVPEGGVPARRRPAPSLPVLMRIKTGVELIVARRQGDWALVETDTGWQAWVDGRRLEPIGPGTEPESPPATEPSPPPDRSE